MDPDLSELNHIVTKERGMKIEDVAGETVVSLSKPGLKITFDIRVKGSCTV